ncbi:MAG: glycosyltransferase [Thermomicrobiales bacterium]|nr:glycosyltransferase [Thermomicrobiales bacterium]
MREWVEHTAAERALESGNELFTRGAFAGAVEAYSDGIQRDPSSALALYNRANALAMVGRLNDSLADYDLALSLAPTLEEARFNRYLVYQRLLAEHDAMDGQRDVAATRCPEVRQPLEQPVAPSAKPNATALPRVAAVVPAHNEEAIIGSAIESLLRQTRRLDLICIVSDNSKDRTVEIAREYAARHPEVMVMETCGNKAKKAGALNQAMHAIGVDSFDYFFQMDADSIVTETLIEEGLKELETDDRVGGVCSSAFLMDPPASTGRFGRWLWRLQNIEYGFAQAWRMESPDDSRVLAGIGSLLRASALKDIESVKGNGQYWDESSIVEDYVIGLEMKDAGWRVKPAPKMVLFTDGQTTLGNLWRQRLRWYTGTINEIRKRKLRQHSRTELFGILLALFCLFVRVTLLGIVTLAIFQMVDLRFNWWMIALPLITLGHNAYRLSYVHGLDKKQTFLALSVFPMDIYDTFQQVTYLVSTVRSFRGAASW